MLVIATAGADQAEEDRRAAFGQQNADLVVERATSGVLPGFLALIARRLVTLAGWRSR